MSSRFQTPPAQKTGMLRFAASTKGRIFSSTSFRMAAREGASPASNSSSLNPRWPPALAPSTTMKSGKRLYFFIQDCRISFAARPPDTMGAIRALPSGTNSGNCRGKPAPEITASMPEATAVWMASANCCVATIALMASRPRPPEMSRASEISCRSARRFASSGFL